MANYYKTLGIDQSASPDDIKRAYRKLASQHHPDKGGDVQNFQEIEEAYRVLSDPQKRSEYDNPPQQFHFNQAQGFEKFFGNDFKDIFGGANPFEAIFQNRHSPQRNKHFNIQTKISLEEAYYGRDLVANIQLPSGQDQIVNIKIPAGIQSNTTLRFAGMGDNTFSHLPRGDIHLTVHVAEHPIFQRKNDDLIKIVNISCIDAMIGKEVDIETIDKKTLQVSIRPGTQPGQTLAIQGHGMPNMHDNRFKGRLLINVEISVPTSLTSEQISLLQKHFS